MSKRSLRPTDSELEILAVLWAQGPSTVRGVLGALPGSRQVGYTTVLKLLQIMATKGLVKRDETDRTHVYRPAQSERLAQRGLIRDLARRAFGGSATRLVHQALEGRTATRAEIESIRALLDRMEEKGGKK